MGHQQSTDKKNKKRWCSRHSAARGTFLGTLPRQRTYHEGPHCQTCSAVKPTDASSSNDYPSMAAPAQGQLSQQNGPAITMPAPVFTTQAKPGTSEAVTQVTISPATTNQNLKFEDKFEQLFRASSLRGAFQNHAVFNEVFKTGPCSPRFMTRQEMSNKALPGKIIAMSTEIAAAGGAGKSADTATAGAKFALTGAPDGLVSTIMTAYDSHCSLMLSPDEVWLTILAQFCAYTNKNAKGLRNKIVEHEGKQELIAYSNGTLETADHRGMIRDLLGEIRKSIKSPELADWFRPGFSTTTEKDEVCAAATAMASLQAYFAYEACIMCGIPSVTMMGTVADWKLLRQKVNRLLEFEVHDNPEGNVMELWVGYLRKVCGGFVESAEYPGSVKTLAFWDKALSHRGGGSGPSYITGWLSTFTCFDNDGQFIGKNVAEGADFPLIERSEICHNVVSCPVKINDRGVVHDGTLFAGQVAFEAEQGKGGAYPTVRPRNDWCMAVAVKK